MTWDSKPMPLASTRKKLRAKSRKLIAEIRRNRPNILPIARRTFFRRAHPRQNILLHQYVSLVIAMCEPTQQGREVHASFAQFTVHSMPHAREVVPLLFAGAARHVGLDIFQMDIPDALLEAVQSRYEVDVLAARSVNVVAGVEHQSQPLR